jgi:hypothetical protein
MNQAIPYAGSPENANARIMLSLMLIAAACLFADALVGFRGIDVGTDTGVYASVFHAMRDGFIATRFEPGFLLITRALSATGMSLAGYQCVLFLILMGTAVAATHRYYSYLDGNSDYLTFLIASLMFLFLSPVLMNASINAVRQGLASLLVFAALVAFYQRQWRAFAVYAVLSTSFHYSSLVYLLFSPALLLKPRTLRFLGIAAFLAYCSGLTMLLVRVLLPPAYNVIMAYDASGASKTGVRIDFAVFSIFWYLLPFALSRLIQQPVRERLIRGTAIYIVLLLPFFVAGWGSFSNRYLFPGWLSMSVMIAAIFCNGRTPLLRDPLVLRCGLVASCGVFYYYITHMVIL